MTTVINTSLTFHLCVSKSQHVNMVKFSWPFGDHIRRVPLHSKIFIYEENYTQKKWASLLQTQKRSEKRI